MASFVYDDGGRGAAGYRGKAGDCVTRAIAIASGRPYAEVYAVLAKGNGEQRDSKNVRKSHKHKASARNGIYTSRKWFKDYMASLGATWKPTMQIGQGCTVHLRADELPKGRLIVSLSRHLCAVIDGVIHDTFDPSRDGTRCVYGYWTLPA
jgi:hypothetical protein